MPALKVQQFGGQLPAWDDSLLPDGQASVSQNAYLYSGALVGWRKPKLLRALTNSAAKFAYRVPTVVSGTAKAYLAFIDNVNEGDTVKIGEDVYTFTAAVLDPFDVLLGGDATTSATELYKALTLTGTDGVDYGTGTCLNPAISSTVVQSTFDFGAGSRPTLLVKAPDLGAGYNSTVVTESTANARTTWLSDLVLVDTTATLAGGVNPAADLSITGAATWLEFEDADTAVMRSAVVDDTFNRYYFMSPSTPPRYNTYDRIVAAQDPWLLGVPAPGCNPGVDVTAGGNASIVGNNTSTTANTNAPGANTLFLVKVTPGGQLTLDDISTLPADTSTVAKFTGVIYADTAGSPDGLINIGVEVIGATTGTAVVSSFVIPTTLETGLSYWIGFITDASLLLSQYDDTTVGSVAANTYASGAPTTAPVMTAGQPNWEIWGDVTTAALLGTRAYLYTWVTAYDEEGPPSPPTLVTAWDNSTYTISLFTPPPDDMGVVRNITKTRLYRTITATNGSTTYFLVAELDVSTATYTDQSTDVLVSENSEIPSVTWSAPPENLQGLVSMPNGMAVAFRNNEIWFCEPYRPHAWPASYVLTTEFPIIGLGVCGQTVVICTEGFPYTATGVNPSSMALTQVQMPEPCISRGSILSMDQGVYYASSNGLIFVSAYGQATNATEQWVTREKWKLLVPQKFIRAVKLASSYFAFGTVSGADVSVAQDGFTIELAPDTHNFTILPQPGGHRIGFNTLTAPNDYDVDNVMMDKWTGIGMLIQNSSIYYYDFSDTVPDLMVYTWRSKMYQQAAKKNFAVFKVWFGVPPGTPTQNLVRNEADPQPTLATDQYAIVRVYAGDDASTLNLVTTREIRTSGELLRITSGFKYEFWAWEIEGRVRVSNLQTATSVRELAGV